jgi:preprotein translocase subunit SecA
MINFISDIKIEAKNLIEKSDEELNLKIEKIKKRVKDEKIETNQTLSLSSFFLDRILVEWFALVQEISFRKIGLRHFETQLLAGVFLHQGKIVEMKTGEGKTLASTLPVALNALSKKGVHVVTVNDYLAERDQKWMGKVYNGLGLDVGLVKSNSTLQEKQKSYNCDITYVTNSELVFDYLRDSSAYNLNELVQRPFNYCVIDEIDSILIDEARTPLILSTVKEEGNINKLYLAKALANILIKDLHFEVDEKRREINLTELGYKEAKNRLGKKTLYDPDDPWILEVLNALKAKYIFRLNKDYIVLNNKVLIVDEFTGRIMEDRRWSLGIHEAIEIKEKVTLGGGTRTKSSITYQNFFTLYPKLAGMTGTAKTTEKEFQDIYNLEVIVLPTQKPMLRKDLSDLVYQTELAKWKAVLKESKECFEKGQPILIGTASVEKSEFLSELFQLSKIPHQVLNAKPENVARESEIVAQAGERYAITIATNMAGRGTDIILGGNPIFKVKQIMEEFVLNKNTKEKEFEEEEYLSLLVQKIQSLGLEEQEPGKGKEERKSEKHWAKLIERILTEYKNELEKLKNDIGNLPYSLENAYSSLKNFYNYLYEKIYFEWESENKLVKQLGGLFVLGTERHETRRIDNQLRGRAGRQGDPGRSQFFISLEDELIKVFGGDSIRRWVEYLIQDKDTPLESDLLTKSLENAQKKVELYNYDLRKNVFQYDDILNIQRKQLFGARNELLSENIYQDLFLRYTEYLIDEEIENFEKNQQNSTKTIDEKNQRKFLNKIEKEFDLYSGYLFINQKKSKKLNKKEFYCEIWISNDLRFAQSNFYEGGFLKNTKSILLLSIIDFYWTEHIERMSYIRETINWRAYGQQNPLIEYNMEAFRSFKLMFQQIRTSMIYYFLNNAIIN